MLQLLLAAPSSGSGKTTAMVQRIIELIKNGANIGDMLIITFTKAAAADMRDKISSAVIDLCAADDKLLVDLLHERNNLVHVVVKGVSSVQS